MPKTITLKQLQRADASREQLDLFKSTFGEFVTVTVRSARAAANQFQMNWFANHLLSGLALKAYRETATLARETLDKAIASEGKTYAETTDSAWRAYNEAIAQTREACRETAVPAWRAYKETTAPAWEAYKETTDLALKAYREAIAEAFAKAYLSDI